MANRPYSTNDPGVDEVVDVLAGGAAVRRVPALDGVRPCRVLGQRTTAQQLGVVVADLALVSHAADANNAAVRPITY